MSSLNTIQHAIGASSHVESLIQHNHRTWSNEVRGSLHHHSSVEEMRMDPYSHHNLPDFNLLKLCAETSTSNLIIVGPQYLA
uniref:Uncharacterized protein n=1 Tax=Medicago truncatula TaxID=3880 RepID=Q2HVL7_MEDTR|nr:hypothetical protein MtrDRAFT_AC148816g23v2 [Medicago truncatula]